MSYQVRAKNLKQILKGKAKARLGKATHHNQDLEVEGKHDQAMGHLKQAGEEVNDALDG
ncbi:MAG TPA: CsbD family protein [Acidimicrobiales bacterium]|nr:CsbD family protein [Acidimicrobiales bacterium]